MADFCFYVTTFCIYLTIQIVFLCRLRINLRQKFETHKWSYLIQSLGMQWYMVVKIILDASTLWPWFEIKKEGTYFMVSSGIFFIQITAAFIFVLTKHPEDCFACFNRMDGSKRNYSQYQYSVEEQAHKKDTYSRMIHEQSQINLHGRDTVTSK
jgi:hypothetical protein